jgi:plasmid rolling circle replication initiator protein Rep
MELIERKLQANHIADLYFQLGYLNYSERIRECARWVRYYEKSHWECEYIDDFKSLYDVVEKVSYYLTDAHFCRVRLCPICQWRKSKRWQALAVKSFPEIKRRYPDHRWLFLTLTIKNCKLSNLHNRVIQLNKSFLKWVKWKKFPADGWVKSLEVTLDNSDVTKCHPHFHVLLLVPSQYFIDEEMYLSHDEWIKAWRKAAKLSYQPSVNIQSIPRGYESALIPELLKYGVKPDDLARVTGEQLDLLTQNLHGVHAVNKGGILRDYFRGVGSDDVDLIGVSDENLRKTGDQLQYRWLQNIDSYQQDWISERYKFHCSCVINQDNYCSEDLEYEELEFISNKSSNCIDLTHFFVS